MWLGAPYWTAQIIRESSPGQCYPSLNKYGAWYRTCKVQRGYKWRLKGYHLGLSLDLTFISWLTLDKFGQVAQSLCNLICQMEIKNSAYHHKFVFRIKWDNIWKAILTVPDTKKTLCVSCHYYLLLIILLPTEMSH